MSLMGGEGRTLTPELTSAQERIKAYLDALKTSSAPTVNNGVIESPQSPATLAPGPVVPPIPAGDGSQRAAKLSPAEKRINMADCNPVYVPKTYDEPGEARDTIREVSESARHGVAETSRGNQFTQAQLDRASIDRASQDRYLAGEFRGLGVAAAQVEARLQKDNVDLAHYLSTKFGEVGGSFAAVAKSVCDVEKDILQNKFELSTAIERNGRSAELATEKVGAAVALAGEKQAAATALCCCETRGAIAASTASILAAFQSNQLADLQRLLTVSQVRQGIPLSVTPVG